MLLNVLHAPMSFFDTNPKGRVVNRFAKDVDLIDRQIPMTFLGSVDLLSHFTKVKCDSWT